MATTTETSPPAPRTLAIVGVGLLGGSIARAARQRGLVEQVLGIGRNQSRLEQARDAGVIDEVATSLSAAGQADLVIVCTPVDRLAEDVIAIAQSARPTTTITDVGSIKAAIVQQVDRTPAAGQFVPSHPLAGSEQTGWEASSPKLFEQRLCVITPGTSTDPGRVAQVERFWQGLGMQTCRTSPEEHDQRLAVTSHLPHVIAAAMALLVGEQERPFAATGFRDTTRIASGDPTVWTPILLGNSASILDGLQQIDRELQRLRNAIEQRDAAAITDWLDEARLKRNAVR